MYEQSCYYVSTTETDATAATTACVNLNSNLVIIGDQAEQNFVESISTE